MPEFTYKAKRGPTEVVSGMVSADTKQDAMRLIEEQGYIPVEINPLSTPGVESNPGAKRSLRGAEGAEAIPQRNPSGRLLRRRSAPPRNDGISPEFKRGSGKVPAYHVCVFARQLAGFLRSHVQLLEAIEMIRNQNPEPRLRALLERVCRDVRGGRKFSDSLEEHGNGSFDTRFLSMVRAGEAGGSLDEILETLANHLENEEELRGQIRTALAYPVLVVLVGSATLFFLFTFCVPRLSNLFNQGRGTLPLPTRMLLSVSQPEAQVTLWIAFLAALFMLLFFFVGPARNSRGVQIFISKIPVLGTARLKADVSRFASTLAMLLQNGVPIYQAIEISRPILADIRLKEDLANAQNRVMGGEMLTSVLKNSHFPQFFLHMLTTGEESGRLSDSLKEIARFYSRESLRSVKLMTSLIEPLFILGLSLVVGFVVAGIILPIFDMNWIK